MWYRGGVFVYLFSYLDHKKKICEQIIEKTSSKIERELCTIEIHCRESLYCKINTSEVILV